MSKCTVKLTILIPIFTHFCLENGALMLQLQVSVSRIKDKRGKDPLIGIGQSLRGDDAAGLEAVRLWQAQYPQTAQKLQVELSELPGLALLDRLDGMEAAILVDAVQSRATPGTIQRLGPEELAAFSTDAQSAHGWGVAETLALGRSL